jgi:hypothetical protein
MSGRSGRNLDFIQEAQAAVLGRVRDPLVLGYLLGFVVVNWRFFYTLAVPDESTVAIIQRAAATLDGASFGYPVLVAAFWAVVLPYVTTTAALLRRWARLYYAAGVAFLQRKERFTVQGWLRHPTYQTLQSIEETAKAERRDFKAALRKAWRRAWPGPLSDSGPRVLALRNPGNQVDPNFAIHREGKIIPIHNELERLSGGDLSRELVFVFECVREPEVALAVEPGGFVPQVQGLPSCTWLLRNGKQSTENAAPGDAFAVVEQLPAPDSEWAQFRLLPHVVLSDETNGV